MASPALGAIPATITNPESVQAYNKNSKLPFFRLSIEVRVIIYEYVVACGHSIHPRQVTEKSNKFVWGAYTSEWTDRDDMGRRSRILVPKGNPLMVTQLMKTCQQMYWDLTRHPVFYRVNTFVLTSPTVAHQFLAAITPTRRKTIRMIRLMRDYININFPDGNVATFLSLSPVDEHIMVLLQDCADLRTVVIMLGPVKAHTVWLLATGIIEQHAIFSSHVSASPRGFRVVIKIKVETQVLIIGTCLPGQGQRLQWASVLRTKLDSNTFRETMTLLARVSHLLAEYNGSSAARQLRRTQVDTSPPKAELHMAIESAGIDFPGDTRVEHIRSIGLKDTISHRTRAKVKAENNVTPWGTIKKNTPKYNFEGLLLWDYLPHILGLRWNGSSIEAEVEWPRPLLLTDEERSWEEIHHLGNWIGVHRIRMFFSRMTKMYSATPEFIEQIEKMPTPEDVEAALDGLLVGNFPKARLDEWTNLRTNYKLQVDALKKIILEKAEARKKMEAERLERIKAKEAAKAEMKAAKQQAKAAKTLTNTKKTSRVSEKGASKSQ